LLTLPSALEGKPADKRTIPSETRSQTPSLEELIWIKKDQIS
jgi:hypothetical protein